MKQNLLSGLSIRTGAVRKPDIGYILACDPDKEEDRPHTTSFTWKTGIFNKGSSNFNAYTCCVISLPSHAFLQLAGLGEYGISTANGNFSGNIFDARPKRAKRGVIRMVTEIAGKAYATGLGGIVYRLDDFVKWVGMDRGLPKSLNIEAIDGFDATDIYVAGDAGALWHFDGRKWSNCDLPTNANFNTVKCAGNGNVYVAGNDGHLLCGREDTWDFLAEDEINQNIWDIEWFEEKLYLSTMAFVYCIKEGELDLVDFGDDTPDTCYQLSAAKGVMWSIGSRDVMSFDGKTWTRIV